MAEALLRARTTAAGLDVRVHSAGLLEGGSGASPDGVAVMGGRGLDTSTHRSRQVTEAMIDDADLVIGMARGHVREAVLLVPDAFPRIYTLKELVRRGEQAGGRAPGQPLDEWLNKLHAGRTHSDLLGSSPDDDVADPIGRPRAEYERTAAELDDLVTRLFALVWGERGERDEEAT